MTAFNQPIPGIEHLLDQYVDSRHQFNSAETELVAALKSLVGTVVSLSGYPTMIGAPRQNTDSPNEPVRQSMMPAHRLTRPRSERKLYVLPANTLLAASAKSLLVESMALEPETFVRPRLYEFSLKNIVAIAQLEVPAPAPTES